MNTWVLQMGFPVVTINTTNGQVSQQHFLLDPDSEVTTPSSFGYVHPPSVCPPKLCETLFYTCGNGNIVHLSHPSYPSHQLPPGF